MGFTGGLRGGGGGGVSAPYLATLTLEALYHVATRMPADSPDAILNKVGYPTRALHCLPAHRAAPRIKESKSIYFHKYT